MKTHELAKQLSALSKALKILPNMNIEDLGSLGRPSRTLSDDSIAMGLTTLAALSDVDKTQWQNFILDHQMPIDVRPRDASRDILGKILTYLQANKDARRRLANSSANRPSSTSPELQRALQLLLRD